MKPARQQNRSVSSTFIKNLGPTVKFNGKGEMLDPPTKTATVVKKSEKQFKRPEIPSKKPKLSSVLKSRSHINVNHQRLPPAPHMLPHMKKIVFKGTEEQENQTLTDSAKHNGLSNTFTPMLSSNGLKDSSNAQVGIKRLRNTREISKETRCKEIKENWKIFEAEKWKSEQTVKRKAPSKPTEILGGVVIDFRIFLSEYVTDLSKKIPESLMLNISLFEVEVIGCTSPSRFIVQYRKHDLEELMKDLK
jgi:hypothetical protein